MKVSCQPPVAPQDGQVSGSTGLQNKMVLSGHTCCASTCRPRTSIRAKVFRSAAVILGVAGAGEVASDMSLVRCEEWTRHSHPPSGKAPYVYSPSKRGPTLNWEEPHYYHARRGEPAQSARPTLSSTLGQRTGEALSYKRKGRRERHGVWSVVVSWNRMGLALAARGNGREGVQQGIQ